MAPKCLRFRVGRSVCVMAVALMAVAAGWAPSTTSALCPAPLRDAGPASAIASALLAAGLCPAVTLAAPAASREVAAAQAASGGGTYNLRVISDASPDLSDLDSLVVSTTSRWSAAREKVWALFYWTHILKRQTSPMLLHGQEVTDPIRNFTDYGFTMCSTVSGINQTLHEHLGLPHQYWDICNHTVSAVQYDGAFRMVDSSMSNLVTTDDGISLATVQQAAADSARLVRQRSLYATSPNGFLSGTDSMRNLSPMANPSGGTLAGFASTFCENSLKLRDYYYNWDAGHRYILNLRANESYTRYYRRLGATSDYWVGSESISNRDPASTFEIDSANRFGIRGNGRWSFTPSLAAGAWNRAVYGATNVIAADTGLKPGRPGEAGEAVYKVQAANAIASQKIDARFSRTDPLATATISLSLNHGASWVEVATVGSAVGGDVPVVVNLRNQVSGAYETLLRIRMQSDAASPDGIVLTALAIETLTHLNTKALPRLNIGRNEMFIGAGDQSESMVLWPQLRGDLWKQDVFDSQNIAAQPVTVPVTYTAIVYPAVLSQDAYLTYRMEAPADIRRFVYGGRLHNYSSGSYIDFLHSYDNGATWTRSYRYSGIQKPYDVIHYETVTDVPPGVRTVLFKYLIHNTSASASRASGLYSARMEVNHTPVDAEASAPIDVTISWKEIRADRTQVDRSHRQRVSSFPFKYVVNVGGSDHPVMESLDVRHADPADATLSGYADGTDPGGQKYVHRKRTDGTNLAEGAAYTFSRAPSGYQSSATTANTTLLTDGVVGAPATGSYSYWWGQCWSSGTPVSLQVNLGLPRTIGTVRAHLFGYSSWDAFKGQVLDRVEVLTSLDGVTFESQGLLPTSLWRKDVPINHMLPDDEKALAWNFELTLPAPVSAQYVRYNMTPKRNLCVSELQLFDRVSYEPFDIRVALPPIAGDPIPANQPPGALLTSPSPGGAYMAGAPVNITANAWDLDGAVARVDFLVNDTVVASDTSAPWSGTWSPTAPGTHTLTARAVDDAGDVTTSAAVNITAAPAGNVAPAVVLTSPVNGGRFDAPAAIAMVADATDSDGAIARVDFYSGATLLGSSAANPFVFTWSNVPAGSYSLTAHAADDEGSVTVSSPVAVLVEAPANAAPVVTLTGPAAGTFDAPASISLSAEASDPDGSIARVDFLANGTLVGTSATAPYEIAWSGAPAGSYSLTASAIDNAGAVSVSAPVLIAVADAPPPPPPSASAAPFKVAFWNVKSGNGASGLPGQSCGFTVNSNCTDASLPLNAWGRHVLQDELIQHVQNDPAVVAIGLAEAWACASPGAVQQALGWKSKTDTKGGVGLVARYGFAGPEQWVQLDTSMNLNPADAKWVVRVPVCLDETCTRSVAVFSAHFYALGATDFGEYNTQRVQAAQALDFMSASASEPHLIVGDLNMFDGTQILCGQNPRNEGIDLFRSRAYVDAWPAVHGTADGSTGMWNRDSCGVPEGSLWKRIDYGWSWRMNPMAISRFGMVEPGQCAPSDHAGIIVTYAMEDASVPAPTAGLEAPAEGATVSGVVPIAVTASDAGGIARVELMLDRKVIAVLDNPPYTFNWDTRLVSNGVHVLEAAASNVAGQRVVTAPRSVIVENPSGPGDELIMQAADATVVGSEWTFVDDSTAAAGRRLQNSEAGAAPLTKALANPASYVELTFFANVGIPYRLWIRGVATGNASGNDAVHVQFTGAVNEAGAPIFVSGTNASTVVNIEDCQGCGLSGWGWQDNGYARDVLGPLVYFAAPGPHRLRIQAKEDGLGIDQVVLSAVRYRFTAPGRFVDDTTKLGSTVTPNVPPVVDLTAPAAAAAFEAPGSITIIADARDSDGGISRVEFFANGLSIGSASVYPYAIAWNGVPAGQYALSARATDVAGATSASAVVTVTVTAPPPPPNVPPSVQLTAPADGTTTIAPATVLVQANATDTDGGVTRIEFFAGSNSIGVDTAAPYSTTWTNVAAGNYSLTAVATDVSGASTVSSPVSISVNAPPPPGASLDEIVMHAAVSAQITGGWAVTTDATAAAGARLQNPNLSAAKVATALAAPPLAFDVTFEAEAGKAYRLWLRGKGLSDHYNNDSVFVQFDGSVNAGGQPIWRTGTTDATIVVLEDCSGCGIRGWGWGDNGYGANVMGPLVYFARTGTQRLRIQAREDGLAIDQIVLSAVKYKSLAPGATKSDTTILAVAPAGAGGPAPNVAPQVSLTQPAPGSSATAPATMALTAAATDSDGSIAAVEFYAGSALIARVTSQPYSTAWSNVAAGTYLITARATDNSGATTQSAGVNVTVNAPPPPGNTVPVNEIVLYAAADASIGGGWSVTADASAAGGALLQNPNLGAAKLATALAGPGKYFELTFTADAGKPYRLWMRGRALADNYNNDSIFMQFDGSVDASGQALWRIGTTSATSIVLEDCSGCGLKGWGWADNAYGLNTLGAPIYFATSGPQRLRIQIREDGLGIDQIVLSAATYFTAAPGATKLDATIVPR